MAIERKNEKDTLTLVSRIDHHFATSMATLEAVSQRQERIVKEFIKFHEDAASNPGGSFKTYVVKTQGNEERVRSFTDWLTKQGFEYGQAGKNISTKGTELTNGSDQNIKIESNDLLISSYQPKSNLIRVLFETKPILEDSVTYDLTSWGLSYLFGLKTYGLKDKLAPVAYVPPVTGNKVPQASPYAYLARWSSVEDAVFLSELLKRNLLVRSSNVDFEIDNQKFEAGSLVITKKGNNQKNFDELVTKLADKHHVQLLPVKTGFVTTGADFGSDFVPVLKSPKVVTVAGQGISATSFGSVWHYFEKQIEYPMTIVDPIRLSSLPWNDIDVLILPDGKYTNILTEKVLDMLQDWIKNGGKLIAMEKSTDMFVNKTGFGLSRKIYDKGKESDVFKKFGDQERVETSDSSPGSMFSLTLEKTHPLAFGCGPEYYTLVRDSYNIDYLKDGWNVGYLTDKAYMAGFVGKKMTEKLKNTLIMGVQPIGKGQVVYLMDDPLFRGMIYNGKILFSNAVFR